MKNRKSHMIQVLSYVIVKWKQDLDRNSLNNWLKMKTHLQKMDNL